MKLQDAYQILKTWDQRGRYVFTKHELQQLFPEDNTKTLSEGLRRLVKAALLKHACRNIYVNEHALHFDSSVLEQIAKKLRRGEYNYISLESALSEYGIISQIPIDRITVMTTGRSGLYNTPYGVIEFTHTKRSVKDILNSTIKEDERTLRIAQKQTALRDLKRVGRNLHLIKKGAQND